MIRFILNNKLIQTAEPPGMLLLDFIRYSECLMGTKIGCREGDCGACTVLIGEMKGGRSRSGGGKGEEMNEGRVVYGSVTSCLTALGNVHQKHIVTIEGLNGEGLNFLQRVIGEEGGTQCGFCTPGFVLSMAGFCLSDKTPTRAQALAAVDGNICRCTGYKSIERALERVVKFLEEGRQSDGEDGRDIDGVGFSVKKEIVPEWFAAIPGRLAALALQPNGVLDERKGGRFLGGGTDLYVQQHAALVGADLEFLAGREDMRRIREEDGSCVIGGAATVTDMMESPVIRKAFPQFDAYVRLISSTPIRNTATVAGNFVNASPIGDLSIFFPALDAQLTLNNGVERRELPLRNFFSGYKLLNKEPDEYIERISFPMPDRDVSFHFEKVSKRTHLDIASVNTAIWVRVLEGRIVEAAISAGGVGPVPAYLEGASAVMIGRRPDPELLAEVVERAEEEISPIPDARGTAEYKRLLLGQLIKAHFLKIFPGLPVEEIL